MKIRASPQNYFSPIISRAPSSIKNALKDHVQSCFDNERVESPCPELKQFLLSETAQNLFNDALGTILFLDEIPTAQIKALDMLFGKYYMPDDGVLMAGTAQVLQGEKTIEDIILKWINKDQDKRNRLKTVISDKIQNIKKTLNLLDQLAVTSYSQPFVEQHSLSQEYIGKSFKEVLDMETTNIELLSAFEKKIS